ncbi:mannosidase, beta A, lysosomal-like, isoform CRA_a, partial [Mus musculus]
WQWCLGPWPPTWASHLLRCLSPPSWRTCCGMDSSWEPSSSSSVSWPSSYPFPSPTRRRQNRLSPEVQRGRRSPRLPSLPPTRGRRRRRRRSDRILESEAEEPKAAASGTALLGTSILFALTDCLCPRLRV